MGSGDEGTPVEGEGTLAEAQPSEEVPTAAEEEAEGRDSGGPVEPEDEQDDSPVSEGEVAGTIAPEPGADGDDGSHQATSDQYAPDDPIRQTSAFKDAIGQESEDTKISEEDKATERAERKA